MEPNVDVARLAIERDCARVPLPDSEPQGLGAKSSRFVENVGHELLRQSATVPLTSQVETQEFDRGRPRDAIRRMSVTQLREGHEVFAILSDKRQHFGIDK